MGKTLHVPAMGVGLLCLLAWSMPCQSTGAGRPLVRTSEGPVLGVEKDGVRIFRAVPFAAPPVGPLRFRPPSSHRPWARPIDASVEAPACPQTAGSLIGKASEQEDCLYLNVWTAPSSARRGRPVMVWIHGSGTKGWGGSAYFDGFRLAKDNGVVVVTVNYRLGLLGSLVSPALDDPGRRQSGDYWLRDQQAALRWIRRNAKRFGGDPERVTVFGESAGGASVLALLASPASKGLFQRAIIESFGGAHLQSRAEAEEFGRTQVLPKIGCAGTGDVAACLRAAPVSAFLAAPAKLIRVADSELLPLDPLEAFGQGRFLRAPVLIGFNEEEGHYGVAGIERDLGRRLTDADYAAGFGQGKDANAKAVFALYPASRFPSPAAAASRLITDTNFACPADLAERRLSLFAPVYAYEFSPTDPVQQEPLWAGTELPNAAYHTSEEPYVFDVDHDRQPLSGRAAALSRLIRGFWAGFARSGDPNGGGRPQWPRFHNERPMVLELSADAHVSQGLSLQHNCPALEALGALY